MDESSHGGCECSEPPSALTEQEEPPGSGLLPVLSVADSSVTTTLDRSDAGSILNQARNHSSATTLKSRAGMAPPASNSSAAVSASADTESASRTERNGVRVDSAHVAGRSLRVENPLTVQFRERFYPDTTDTEWDDWRWQSRHRVKTLDQFEKMLDLSFEERDVLSDGGTLLPTAVTPYYMSLLDPENPLQALRKTVVPTTREFVRTAGEADDPLGVDLTIICSKLKWLGGDAVSGCPIDHVGQFDRWMMRVDLVS